MENRWLDKAEYWENCSPVVGKVRVTNIATSKYCFMWLTVLKPSSVLSGIIAFLTLLGACGTAYGVHLKWSDKGATTQNTARTAHSYINMAFNGETHTSGRTTLQEVKVQDKNPSPTVTSSPEPVESGVIRSRGNIKYFHFPIQFNFINPRGQCRIVLVLVIYKDKYIYMLK